MKHTRYDKAPGKNQDQCAFYFRSNHQPIPVAPKKGPRHQQPKKAKKR